MGNNQSEINSVPNRWFKYKSYPQKSNIKDNNDSYYNNLIINKGYLIPLSIEKCNYLEKQLNLNNEGLSTKYFFKYDYKDKFITVTKEENIFKRLKIPINHSNNIYKIKRLKRFSKNTFRLINSNNINCIKELRILYYKNIFKDINVDTNDKFIIKFINHVGLMHKDLCDYIQQNLRKFLIEFYNLDKDEFNFEKMKHILINNLKKNKNKKLEPYNKFFLYDLTKDNFEKNIIRMIIEEGDLIDLINKIYNNKLEDPYLLFYILCLQFSFDNICNSKEIITCYKALDKDFIKEEFIPGNLLMNFEYMSVSKDKNILNINSNKSDDNFEQNIVEIEIEKPCFKNWYLSFKALDTENISQYPIEKEIIIQPYSLFEVKEVIKLANNNLYIKLKMKSNLLSNLSNYDYIPKQFQQNLGLIIVKEENILESYLNINFDNIVSITFKSQNNLIKNKEYLGKMKNLKYLDINNLNLVDKNIKDLIPFIKDLNFLNYINISLNNLSHFSLEYLENIFSEFPYIEHLILDQNSFGNEGIISLSKGLKTIDGANIKSLSLFYNQIKSEGIDALSLELKKYKNLYYLNLSTNFIFYEEIDELVYAIKNLNNLIELNLSNNQISSEGLSYIGEILPKTIQKLNFSENEIYQDGFYDFGNYLKRMPNLMSLIIYGNRNGPSGIDSLLDGFENCIYLNYLDFGCTRIEDCDIVLILKKIRKIKNIKFFSIKENNLTDDSIYFLNQCIHSLTELEILDISWNAIEGANLPELFGILKKMKNFKCINIEGNSENEKNLINNLLDILNQGNQKEKKWNYNKGKFTKNEKIITDEEYINKYISDIK